MGHIKRSDPEMLGSDKLKIEGGASWKRGLFNMSISRRFIEYTKLLLTKNYSRKKLRISHVIP